MSKNVFRFFFSKNFLTQWKNEALITACTNSTWTRKLTTIISCLFLRYLFSFDKLRNIREDESIPTLIPTSEKEDQFKNIQLQD